MKKISGVFIFAVAMFSLFLFSTSASAALLFAAPQSGTHALQEAFSISVKIDSQGDSINAAQARVTFPATILEVRSIDTSNSVFGFWPEAPLFSNENGTIDFIGGTVNGVSGASLHALTIEFIAKSVGEAPISLDNGAITIDDGTGTNVLTGATGANHRVSVSAVIPPLPSVSETATSTQQALPLPGEPIPPPVIIERVPEPAKGLPEVPHVSVPLYPSPDNWYNIATPFNATWALPLDITDVATAINVNPNFTPQKSERLFDNKIFDSVPEGVSYLHVRFRNAIGWGPATHYRLAIDTAPPTPFIIESLSGFQTDDPAPIFQFETNDALSGIKHYLIKIGDAEAFEWKSGKLQLPLQQPGARKVSVRAIDFAGNGTSANVDLITIPIASPVITFVTEKMFFGAEEGITVKGTALPNIDVRVSLMKASGELISEHSALADSNGNWDLSFGEPLGVGAYAVFAQTKDARGALSLMVQADPIITVKSRPIITIGALEVGATGSALVLLIILCAGAGAGYWYFRERQRILRTDVAMTSRDQEHLYALMNTDLEKLTKNFDAMNETEKKFIIDRVNENVQKMEKYILKEIKNIGNGK
ncbi:MAG: cohesin domain-containing protein [Patescibacteria group bacterium]